MDPVPNILLHSTMDQSSVGSSATPLLVPPLPMIDSLLPAEIATQTNVRPISSVDSSLLNQSLLIQPVSSLATISDLEVPENMLPHSNRFIRNAEISKLPARNNFPNISSSESRQFSSDNIPISTEVGILNTDANHLDDLPHSSDTNEVSLSINSDLLLSNPLDSDNKNAVFSSLLSSHCTYPTKLALAKPLALEETNLESGSEIAKHFIDQEAYASQSNYCEQTEVKTSDSSAPSIASEATVFSSTVVSPSIIPASSLAFSCTADVLPLSTIDQNKFKVADQSTVIPGEIMRCENKNFIPEYDESVNGQVSISDNLKVSDSSFHEKDGTCLTKNSADEEAFKPVVVLCQSPIEPGEPIIEQLASQCERSEDKEQLLTGREQLPVINLNTVPDKESSSFNDSVNLSDVRLTLPTLSYTRILLGEITTLVAAMRRAVSRWSHHHHENIQEPLVNKLRQLQVLVIVHATRPGSPPPPPAVFLEPFLAVIRSDETTGPITKTALAAVNRLLSYGLVNSKSPGAAVAVEDIANAVTHARFVGTDPGADEVVLWEILVVLLTLVLGPAGHLLTNESMCELLNSSFRICFETRLSELLRNCTEDALRQMIGLLFARLPQFSDEPYTTNVKRLKMRTSTDSTVKAGKKSKASKLLLRSHSSSPQHAIPGQTDATIQGDGVCQVVHARQTETIESVGDSNIAVTKDFTMQSSYEAASVDSGITDSSLQESVSVDISKTHLAVASSGSLESLQSPTSESETASAIQSPSTDVPNSLMSVDTASATSCEASKSISNSESQSDLNSSFVNAQGVKFTTRASRAPVCDSSLVPHGIACVREVLRFLVSLTSPTNEQNTPEMISTALSLITVALEVGAEHINKCPSLLQVVRDSLCRNLLLLIKPEVRSTILMAALRVCVLVFESMRIHVKFQLEMFMKKLTDIITSESASVSYSHKELCLETVVQLWRIPGLITELFINFDCNLYSDNIFEDLTKILSQNAFPVQGLYSTNLLSLDALLAVVDTLDSHSISQQKYRMNLPAPDAQSSEPSLTVGRGVPCVVAAPASGYLLGIGLLSGFSPVTPNLQPFTILRDDVPISREHLLSLKEKKKLLATGTDQFNVKPEKGIQFLQDNGILGTTTEDIAVFMKENPKLDKKMIGEYLSKKKNVGILSAFVKSFEFSRLRIDQCLRTFLETFRLPGEAPLISIIIEHFSSHWHLSNDEPFGKEDAAFTLAYAVIMLNVDQHNQNAKKQNIPMTLDQFRNNLRGVNDGKDFNQDMLEEIYTAIRDEEIIMPAEQTGLVKENYLWKMLLKRGYTAEGRYMLANDDRSFDRDLFAICWGPTVASLSYVFDKSNDDSFIHKSLLGFKKCASISARYGMSDVFDNLVVSLCKFTGLISAVGTPDSVAIEFGSNAKAQLAAKTLFRLVTLHGDILRDGWKNIVEVLLQLFRARILPQDLTQSPDLLEGSVCLYRPNSSPQPRVEPSLLSSLYSYIALGDGGTRGTSPEDEVSANRAKQCIVECHIEKLIRESAFLRHDALNDMLKAIMTIGDGSSLVVGARGGPDAASGDFEQLDEYGHALLLEIVVQIIVANKDRASLIWSRVHDYILSLMMTCAAASKSSASTDSKSQQHMNTLPAPTGEGVWLLTRCVSTLLRLAVVLVRRPGMSSPMLQSLKMFFVLSPYMLATVALQVVAGVHELLTLTADHVTHAEDWAVLFSLLECAGAGAKPPPNLLPRPHPLLHMRSLPESEIGSSSGPDSGHVSEAGSSPEATALGIGERTISHGTSIESSAGPGGWIMVGAEGGESNTPSAAHSYRGPLRGPNTNQWDIVHQREFWGAPLPATECVVRAVDTLAFLVRERHMTSASLPCAVQTVRTFVEATLHGGRAELQRTARPDNAKSPQRRRLGGRKRGDDQRSSSSGGGNSSVVAGGRRIHNARSAGVGGAGGSAYDADESDSDDIPVTVQQLSEKLLDLLVTLHTTAGSVMTVRGLDADPASAEDVAGQGLLYSSQSELPQGRLAENCSSADLCKNSSATDDSSRTKPLDFSSSSLLWQEVLCPLLQGIARYCCDTRQRVRHLAMTYLQRALLNHELQTLDAHQWEACFNKVLFPLLSALLPSSAASSPQHIVPQHVPSCKSLVGFEETRLRAVTLVQKVYLRHLTTILALPTFTALWLTILDFLDKYLNINTSDHLSDAVPELLKNMLLVMETTQVFHTAHGFTRLWSVTWDRVDTFLPGFRTELFKSHPPSKINRIDVAHGSEPDTIEGQTQPVTSCESQTIESHSQNVYKVEAEPNLSQEASIAAVGVGDAAWPHAMTRRGSLTYTADKAVASTSLSDSEEQQRKVSSVTSLILEDQGAKRQTLSLSNLVTAPQLRLQPPLPAYKMSIASSSPAAALLASSPIQTSLDLVRDQVPQSLMSAIDFPNREQAQNIQFTTNSSQHHMSSENTGTAAEKGSILTQVHQVAALDSQAWSFNQNSCPHSPAPRVDAKDPLPLSSIAQQNFQLHQPLVSSPPTTLSPYWSPPAHHSLSTPSTVHSSLPSSPLHSHASFLPSPLSSSMSLSCTPDQEPWILTQPQTLVVSQPICLAHVESSTAACERRTSSPPQEGTAQVTQVLSAARLFRSRLAADDPFAVLPQSGV